LIRSRFTIFTLATLLSGFGIFASTAALTAPFMFPPTFSYHFMATIILAVSNFLAWFFYFKMARMWIHELQIPKKIAVWGTVTGCISLAPLFFGFVFVLPAMILSCYMVFITFRPSAITEIE
jgi:apolipoprotein N-acyltransferase